MKWLVLAALLAAPLAEPAARASSHRRQSSAPLRVELTVGAERMNYGNAMFTGHPKLDGRSFGAVNLTGKSIGAKRIGVFDTALHIEGITHHVVMGLGIGFLYAGLDRGGVGLAGADPTFASASHDHVATGSSLSGVYVGPTIGTAWTWKSFDLAITTTFGYRELGVSLLGFDPVPCGKNGTSRCPPAAENQAFFAQPRIALGIHHDTWGMGGYVGGDLTTSASGWSMGIYLETADLLFRQRANAKATAPSAEAR